MFKRKNKVNIFDIFVVTVLVLAISFFVVAFNNKPYLGSKNVAVEVRVSDAFTIESISNKLKNQATVFFSGTKYPVAQSAYRFEYDANNQIKYIFIKLEGLGDIAENNSIFNGQRIYINQKVEIHGDYWAQGYISDYKYED